MSICAQQVRLALEEKGVTWRSHLVNLAGMEHLNPWYMRINPRGVVPTLMDDERLVIDSVTILHYIDKNFIGPKLTPDGVGEQHTMHEWLALNEEFPITDLTFGNLAGLFGRVQRAKLHNQVDRVQYLLKKNPDLQREYTVKLAACKAVVTGIETRHSVEQANTQAAELIARLEIRLQSNPYIAGEQYSLADIAWTTMLERLRTLNMDHLWENRPAVVNYDKRLCARPSVQTAMVAFNRPSVKLKMLLSSLVAGFRTKLSSN